MSLIIDTVLCRAGLMDNYSYIIVDKDTKTSAIVDPSEVAPIVERCKKLGLKPSYVLNTHHHFDHTEGNTELKKIYGLQVVGAEKRIPELDILIKPDTTFDLGNSQAEAIDVSAHTQGHVIWYFEKDKALFTGDTLFNLCIGGLFEGTVENMFEALKKIRELPDDTMFYPGHEYTLHGINFALKHCNGKELVEYIKTAEKRLSQNHPNHPIPLGLEKKCNPYLAAETPKEFENLF